MLLWKSLSLIQVCIRKMRNSGHITNKLWTLYLFRDGILSCCNLLGTKINVFMLKYCAFPQSRRKAPPLRFTGTMLKIKTLGHYPACVKLTSKTPEWSCLKSSLCLFRQIGHLFLALSLMVTWGQSSSRGIAVFKHSLSVVTLIVLSSINIKFYYFSVNNETH